jgi:hypothetical protein
MAGMLRCYDNVHVVLGTDTVIEAGKQAVRIGGKIDTYNVCLLISDMIHKSRILMGKSVVVLLPYVGGQDQVQGSDLLSPRKLVANLKPLSVLCAHGVYDTDECFVGCEEAVTTGQKVTL